MPQLSFAAEFADLVADGRKRQTIRKPRKGRQIKVGDTLHLMSGPYSGKRRRLGVVECESVFRIRITEQSLHVGMDPKCGCCFARAANGRERKGLAQLDGFEDYTSMREWFERNGGLPFEGYLIKWDWPGENE